MSFASVGYPSCCAKASMAAGKLKRHEYKS